MTSDHPNVFYISGHSRTNAGTVNRQVILKPGQYIITMTRCGHYNYFQKKKIFNYLASANGVRQLQNALVSGVKKNQQDMIKYLNNHKLPSEISKYQVHSNNGVPYFDQQIDIMTEPYTGIRKAPNAKFMNSLVDNNYVNRAAVAKKRIKYASGEARAKTYKTNKDLKTIWVSDFIGDKPGIYIINTCQSNPSAGVITYEHNAVLSPVSPHPWSRAAVRAALLGKPKPIIVKTRATKKTSVRQPTELHKLSNRFTDRKNIARIKIPKRLRTFQKTTGGLWKPANSGGSIDASTRAGLEAINQLQELQEQNTANSLRYSNRRQKVFNKIKGVFGGGVKKKKKTTTTNYKKTR